MKNYTRIKIENPDLLFFTADPHFFHDRIIEICGRPFRDADDMRESLIHNWNAVVPKCGYVFVLGDMFWKRGDMEKCVRLMDRLNGKNLHGHVHGRGSHFSFRVMDVGVDANNYMPVPWRDVVKRLDGGMELDERGMLERGDIHRHHPYSFQDLPRSMVSGPRARA